MSGRVVRIAAIAAIAIAPHGVRGDITASSRSEETGREALAPSPKDGTPAGGHNDGDDGGSTIGQVSDVAS